MNVSLEQVLTGLAGSLSSLDIRAAVIKQPGGSLAPLLVAVRVSDRSVEEVRSIHRALEAKFKARESALFAILMDALPFEDAENTLQLLTAQRLRLEGREIQLPVGPNPRELTAYVMRDRLQTGNQVERPGVYYPLPSAPSLSYQDPKVTADVRSRLGIRSLADAVEAFLEIPAPDRRSTTLVVDVEMPAWITSVSATGHRVLVRVCAKRGLEPVRVFLTARNRSSARIIWHEPLPTLEWQEEGTFRVCAVETELPALVGEEDRLDCALTGDSVPELDEVTGSLRSWWPPSEQNPLLECLSQFWDLEEELIQPLERPYEKKPRRSDADPQDAFQKALAEVLALAGFATINLERRDKMRHPETKAERATIDLLAYHEETRTLILGACTTNVPKAEDYDRLLHATALLRPRFSSHSRIRITPMLFSGQEGNTAAWEEAARRGLLLLNAPDIAAARTLVVDQADGRALLAYLQMPQVPLSWNVRQKETKR